MNEQEEHDQGETSPPEWRGFEVPEDVWNKIVGCLFEEIMGLEKWIEEHGIQITKESTLESLDADSLDRIEFRVKVEDEFNTNLTDDEVQRCQNIGEFASLIAWTISKKAPEPDQEGSE